MKTGISLISAILITLLLAPLHTTATDKTPSWKKDTTSRWDENSISNDKIKTDKINADYLSKLEREVIEETNLARTQPLKYVEFLQEYKKCFINKRIVKLPGRGRTMTKEGPAAVDEAIDALKKVKPCKALSPSKGLSLAAKDHVKDTGSKGITGHSGTDKSSSSDRCKRYGTWLRTVGENISYGVPDARGIVLQLIIDDGVKNRGHRKNLYNAMYGVVGVNIGTHKIYGTMCVLDYAGGYKDK